MKTLACLCLFACAAAADALKSIGGGQLDNEMIGDFADNTGKYKGKTLTMRMRYEDERTAGTLRDRTAQSPKGVPFEVANKARTQKFLIGMTFPDGIEVPRIRYREEVIITFECEDGSTDTGNVVKKVARP